MHSQVDQELETLIRARYPLIYVVSWEEKRVEEALRAISANRRWMRSYKIMSAIARNPKTPSGIAVRLLPYLHPRDITVMSVDRNLPEIVRLAARKLLSKNKSG